MVLSRAARPALASASRAACGPVLLACRPQPRQQCRSINLAPAKTSERKPPSLLSLAQLTPQQIADIIAHSSDMKLAHRMASPKHGLSDPSTSPAQGKAQDGHIFAQTLRDRSIAVMFTKRSTRTRVACETAINALGGHGFFLSPQDIQLGVNESLYDTSKIISSMSDGIIARVDGHEEIEVGWLGGSAGKVHTV